MYQLLQIATGAYNLTISNGTINGTLTPRLTILQNGNVRTGNPSPSAQLWIGRPDVASTGCLVISQNAGGYRNFKMAYDSSTFNFVLGDYGSTNVTNTWTEQILISYGAPANSLVILTNGNVGMGTNNPLTFLDVRGVLYLGGNNGLGTPTSNWGNAGTRIVFWDDSTDVSYSMGMNGATLWYAVPGGTNHIFYVGTTPKTTINSNGLSVSGALAASGSITGNLYLCTMSSVPFSFQRAIGSGGIYGFFIELNSWWYLGYAYLTVSASIVMAGSNTYCWNGVFLYVLVQQEQVMLIF